MQKEGGPRARKTVARATIRGRLFARVSPPWPTGLLSAIYTFMLFAVPRRWPLTGPCLIFRRNKVPLVDETGVL